MTIIKEKDLYIYFETKKINILIELSTHGNGHVREALYQSLYSFSFLLNYYLLIVVCNYAFHENGNGHVREALYQSL